MKARLTLGILGVSMMFFLLALASQQALGAGQAGSDAPLQAGQVRQDANKEPFGQQETRSRLRAQVELLELQKRQVQDQMKELAEQVEEQTSEQIKQLRQQTDEQIKQLKEQADEQMKQLKQRAMRQIKHWQVQAQRQYELLEAQQRVVLVQGGMSVTELKGQTKKLVEPRITQTQSETSPAERKQLRARVSPAASPSIDTKLDKILERLDTFEKRLDRLEKRR